MGGRASTLRHFGPWQSHRRGCLQVDIPVELKRCHISFNLNPAAAIDTLATPAPAKQEISMTSRNFRGIVIPRRRHQGGGGLLNHERRRFGNICMRIENSSQELQARSVVQTLWRRRITQGCVINQARVGVPATYACDLQIL